jgi:hypothetical protein
MSLLTFVEEPKWDVNGKALFTILPHFYHQQQPHFFTVSYQLLIRYEEPNGAKFLCKQNTFNDFVDVARYSVKEWTSPELLSCEGRSAGGMLIGASINQAPDLFRCAILGVPFVDVVGTMCDATIPLTTNEWVSEKMSLLVLSFCMLTCELFCQLLI